MNKLEIQEFLKKHDLSENRFCLLAGIWRTSLRRFLHENASMNLKTADKINLAMLRIEKEGNDRQ